MQSFQKYLQKEAGHKEQHVKQSQNYTYEDDKRNDLDEPEGRGSSARRKAGSRQTFGEKVQRFNKALVGNEEEYQNYDPNYPQNFGYEQPTNQVPQNVYQSTQAPGFQQTPNRYSQAESNYYGQNAQNAEMELAG